ncbi:MAG: hypothetical protein ABR975_00935 [Vulcanimicrobiaceae bacterium]
MYSSTGTYLGSYGIDPSTNKFVIWNADGQEVSSPSDLLPSGLTGAVAVGADGAPVIFNASDGVASYDISGWVKAPTSLSSTDEVYSASGTAVGSVGYESNHGQQGFTVNGSLVNNSVISNLGLSSLVQTLETAISSNQSETAALANDREELDAALSAAIEGEYGEDTDQTVLYTNGGTEVATIAAAGEMSVDSGVPNAASVYLEALGLTQADDAEAAATITGYGTGSGGANPSALKAVDAALTAYAQNDDSSLAPTYVSALSSGQLSDIWSDLSAADVPYVSPDALGGVSASLFATSAGATNASNLGANAVGLTGTQLGSLASYTGLSVLSGAGLNALTASQLSGLTSDELATLSGAQLEILQGTGGLSASQVAAAAALQVQNLNTATMTTQQIAALVPAQLNQLSTGQWDSLDVADLSSAQISGMSTYAALDQTTLNNLGAAGLLSSMGSLSTLSNSVFNGIAASTLAGFSASAFETMTEGQTEELNASSVADVNSAQLNQWMYLGVMAPTAFAGFSVSALSGYTSDRVTGAQLSALSAAQFNGLFTAISLPQINIRGEQVAAMPSYANLSNTSIDLIREAGEQGSIQNLSTLSTSTISSLDAANLQGFSGTQLTTLITAQWDNLNVSALSASQLAGMSSYAALDAATVGRIQSAGLLAGITNLSTLSDSTISNLSDSVLQNLTTTQLGTLSVPQSGSLSSTEIAIFSSTQVDSIVPADMGIWSAQQQSGLSATDIASIDQAQLSALATNSPNVSLYIDYHSVAVVGIHLYVAEMVDGRVASTIAGEPSLGGGLDQTALAFGLPTGGQLEADINGGDLNIANPQTIMQLTGYSGSAAAFYQKLLALANTYNTNQEVYFFGGWSLQGNYGSFLYPGYTLVMPNTYNSNSFAVGLLQAAGDSSDASSLQVSAILKALTGKFAVGAQNPVPAEDFTTPNNSLQHNYYLIPPNDDPPPAPPPLSPITWSPGSPYSPGWGIIVAGPHPPYSPPPYSPPPYSPPPYSPPPPPPPPPPYSPPPYSPFSP